MKKEEKKKEEENNKKEKKIHWARPIKRPHSKGLGPCQRPLTPATGTRLCQRTRAPDKGLGPLIKGLGLL